MRGRQRYLKGWHLHLKGRPRHLKGWHLYLTGRPRDRTGWQRYLTGRHSHPRFYCLLLPVTCALLSVCAGGLPRVDC